MTQVKRVNELNLGVFSRIEKVVESAVASATGYFATTDNLFRNQI